MWTDRTSDQKPKKLKKLESNHVAVVEKAKYNDNLLRDTTIIKITKYVLISHALYSNSVANDNKE